MISLPMMISSFLICLSTAGCVSCSNCAAFVMLRNSQTVTSVRNSSVGRLVLILSANIARLRPWDRQCSGAPTIRAPQKPAFSLRRLQIETFDQSRILFLLRLDDFGKFLGRVEDRLHAESQKTRPDAFVLLRRRQRRPQPLDDRTRGLSRNKQAM